MCTSVAPASRSAATTCFVVVPRTIESSTTTSRLPADRVGQRVELQLHPAVAQRLRGLDERPADVVVLVEAVAVRDARHLGVPLRAPVAGGRDRDHQVGVRGLLAGEDAAHLPPGLVHRPPAHPRVGPRQVDRLEDAERPRGDSGEPDGCGGRGRRSGRARPARRRAGPSRPRCPARRSPTRRRTRSGAARSTAAGPRAGRAPRNTRARP